MVVRQFFEPLKRALKVNHESSSCSKSNCISRDPKPLSRIQVSRSIKNSEMKLSSIKAQLNNSIKAKLVSSDVRCMICKSHTVTQRVKSLSEIILIRGHQLKSQENIQLYLTINEESNLFILALVTLFISGLDHSISLFCLCSSTWIHYNGLPSIKNKILKRNAVLNGKKLGSLIYASKKRFCSSSEHKLRCPPEWNEIDEKDLQIFLGYMQRC